MNKKAMGLTIFLYVFFIIIFSMFLEKLQWEKENNPSPNPLVLNNR